MCSFAHKTGLISFKFPRAISHEPPMSTRDIYSSVEFTTLKFPNKSKALTSG